jgi:hypothetical protein
MNTMTSTLTSIPCHRATLEELRSLKRGGETYDDLLQLMMNQYDPDSHGTVEF